MSLESFIALRYLRAKRTTGFISIITYVSIAGIAIGVMALILTLSVENGFQKEVRTRLIGADAHLRLRKYFMDPIEDVDSVLAVIRAQPHVVAATPTIYQEAVIKSEAKQSPAAIKAIDLESADAVTEVKDKITFGALDFSPRIIDGREVPGIVLGRYLADDLRALNIGDIVTVGYMPGKGGFFVQPRIMQFYVAGLVEFGYYEYDKILAYISLKDGQELFDIPGATWVEARLEDYRQAGKVGDEITAQLGYPYTATTWFDMHKSLYSWMEIEKWLAFIILSLIIMVAAFNIVSSLVMLVMDKTREIGILKSMGATSRQIMRIFMFEGMYVGLIGTALGSLLGYGIAFIQIKFELFTLPADVYLINAFPVELKWLDFVYIASMALFLSTISSVYPAYKASRLEPVEAIRYE
ncbi:MAG: ABC transporter permease [Calditrichaeota bacterium]|nr:MAG: ABC transporter permease [Calditrichota bacterium]